MDFRILILSDKLLSGQLDFNLPNLLSYLAKNGSNVNSIICNNYDKEVCKNEIANNKGNLIIFTENKFIDEAIIDNIQLLGGNKQMIDDLAVVFKKEDIINIFIPIDIETLVLLDKILAGFKDSELKYCKFHLFGKSTEGVEEELQNLNISDLKYNVLGDNLLTDIYASYKGANNLIDDHQVKIASCFRDNLYSENDLGLSQIVFELLRLKNLKIAIKEDVTGGKVLARLSEENVRFSDVLKAGQVSNAIDTFDAEKIYNDAFDYLKDTISDVVLEISGRFDERGLSCLIAVGDKNSINVYKNRFNAKRKDCLDMATNCALFHLMKKLRQNDFAF